MTKTLLKERFQKLAGIKPLYDSNLIEQERGMADEESSSDPGLPKLDKKLGDKNYLKALISSMRDSSDFVKWYDGTYGPYIQAGANIPTGEQVIANAKTGRGQINEIPWWSIVGGIFGMITAGVKAWNAVQDLCCEQYDWWCCVGMVRPDDPTTAPTATHTMGESSNKGKKGCGCGKK